MTAKILKPTFDPRASEAYGALCEGAHLAGYSFERACGKLEWLLDGDRWRGVGSGFDDVNEFLASIKLDNLKGPAEQRKRIAVKIKQLQPKVSNRQIAKTLGVDESTVRADTAGNPARAGKNGNKNNEEKSSTAGNPAPSLSGAAAANTVARAEKVKDHQATVHDRVAKVAFDAKQLGKFSLILADPPWNDDFGPNRRSTENHYPTMSIEDICALPVGDIAHEQAMLFLWATNPMLELAFRVMRTWGFQYRTNMVWVKPSIGTGKYTRQRHELLLVGRSNNHPAPAASNLPDSVTKDVLDSVIDAPRGAHSAKPEIFHENIERMYPSASKIELFRRGAPRAGWSAWGAEMELREAAE